MSRFATATVLQVGAIATACVVAIGLAVSGGASSTASTVKYTTSPASVTTLTDSISASGTVQPNTTLNLSFSSSTLPVTSVSVKVGQSVKSGQVLATVDSTAAQRQLTTAKAQYTAAVTAASSTSTSTTPGGTSNCTPSATATPTGRPTGRPTSRPTPSTRPTPSPTATPTPSPTATPSSTPTAAPSAAATLMSVVSYARGAFSSTCNPSGSTNRGTTGATGGSSALSLTQAQSQLAAAEAAVAATKLTAPQTGVVQSMDVVVGALPGSPAVVLRADGYQVVVSVAEQDAPFIKVGQVGTVTFSAINASSPAKVVQAATNSSTSSSSGSVASFSVIFSVTEPPSDLLPGMSASVSMVAVTRKSVLTVPTTAIQSGDVGYFVRILQDGQPVNRAVQLGLSTTSLTEITKGLKLGVPVITAVTTS